MNSLMAVEEALKDSLTEATYHPHKNIAGFQQTLYIKTYNNLYCKITEDKPSNYKQYYTDPEISYRPKISQPKYFTVIYKDIIHISICENKLK